ncbi:HAMP domain-containing sensor histidine kinase [Parasegetibacter sp. NRK P23]|uniref:sensor histidine kinase n=1 Tax=Parasegetibacter sp. NRK P23 TaxID=2942999 RepID=UPI0020436D0A|nr:HAMP domain-containing sensor histidine kinase [Parasegetibacter sp. NRK P23]MCM5529669.1 HAMP domain-containing histidine kinase [Parasegetibacter sp. NRK P23]
MKLLQKTGRQYLVSTLVTLLIALPVFYFVLKMIVQEDIDEDIRSARAQMLPELKKSIREGTETQFRFLDHNVSFSPSSQKRSSDTIYTIIIPDTATSENVPHRVLETTFEEAGRFYQLTLRTSLVDTEGLIEAVLVMEVVLVLLLFAALQLVNHRLAGNIWRPFLRTVQQVAAYQVEAQEKPKLEVSNVEEFRHLNQALDQLMERSRNAFIAQREFAENASHEMQTPLAISQSKLELLMQTQPITEEQSALISSIAAANQRLSRLTRSLLLLARMDNNQFFARETIALNKEVTEQLALYKDPIERKQIDVSVEQHEPVTLSCNRTLLEIMIANLLTNAIRHNINGGKIKIRSNAAFLEVSNTGKQDALNETLMFRRFRKESDDPASIGLGLEIVKKIASSSGFSLSYSFEEGWHHFRISFPAY